MALVLGVDSSTQSTKAVLVDSDDGTVIDRRSAPHPPGTEVDPRAWLTAYDQAAGPLQSRAAAIAVGGQQHGMVALDEDGEVVRQALLWNDTRSAAAADDLIAEWGGPQACAEAVGSVLVASFTASKLRWLRDAEPANAARTSAVLLPHDYVSAYLSAPGTEPFTDRGDASGTGYFSTTDNVWRPDLAASALGHEPRLPRIAEPGETAASTAVGQVIGAGTGDNMAAALALGLQPGDVVLSIGTSGVASTLTDRPVTDPSGLVTGFADATGGFLPLVVTINAAKILDLQAELLGVDLDQLSTLALQAPPGANGVTLLPYYGGERTPNRPGACGTWAGLTGRTTRSDLARAAFEALLCSLADAMNHLIDITGSPARDRGGRVVLIGGATRSPAVQALAPAILGQPVHLPPPDEYVAIGAARQAAWALAGGSVPPNWPGGTQSGTRVLEAAATPEVRETYAQLRNRTREW
ncbi:MAG: xylulokinase [Nocardioides sp.]